jgi:hypothetical protein
MALKHKKPATAAQANIDDVPVAAANNDYSDASSSFSDGDIIYTPPDSDDNMASSSRSEGLQAPGSARATAPPASVDGMVTATLGPAVPQDTGAANISMREYIYFLPYPLPLNTGIPYSIYLPGKNPLGLPSCQFEVSTHEAIHGGV